MDISFLVNYFSGTYILRRENADLQDRIRAMEGACARPKRLWIQSQEHLVFEEGGVVGIGHCGAGLAKAEALVEAHRARIHVGDHEMKLANIARETPGFKSVDQRGADAGTPIGRIDPHGNDVGAAGFFLGGIAGDKAARVIPIEGQQAEEAVAAPADRNGETILRRKAPLLWRGCCRRPWGRFRGRAGGSP